MTLKRTISAGGRAPVIVVPPATLANTSVGVWTATNRAVFSRFTLPVATTLRYVNYYIGVTSGNIQLGVVALSGANYLTYTRVMDSGVIAAPAANSLYRADLGATALPAGEYAVFMWCDNITLTTRVAQSTGGDALRIMGHVSSLAGGVPTSGTLAWTTNYVGLTLETA